MNPEHSIRTLADLPEFHARNSPQKTALVYGERTTSFLQLDQRSNQLANALCAEGIGQQAQVAFLDRNSEHFFYILFGSCKANTSLVTVNFRLTSSEIGYILGDAEVELLFVGLDYLPTVLNCKDKLSKLKKIVIVDEDARVEGQENMGDWLAGRAHTLPIDRRPRSSDRAVQMYTSGTTGQPKGVELSQGAMVAAAEDGLSVWPAMYEADASVLATMPLFHIAAANLCIAGLYAGARAEILRDSNTELTINIIAKHRITVVPLPAATIHEIIQLPYIKELDFSRLDTLLIAGSGIAVELLREAQATLECGFALSYGMTECCGGLTYLGPADCVYNAGKKLASAGKPIGNAKIKIIGKGGQQLPSGEIGEILCQTSRVMNGYWNRPNATAEAKKNGWYHSGDAGYLDKEGYLFVVDRIKDMVISGGENIYPVEIENELVKHPAVAEVAVIGVPDSKWGEALLAYVITRTGMRISGDELENFLRSALAGFKIPRRYKFVESFPRNATGKILKRELRTQWQD